MLHFTTLPPWLVTLRNRWFGAQPAALPLTRPALSHLARLPQTQLPPAVQACPVAMKYLHLLGDLDWEHFPERPTHRPWPGPAPAPRAPFVAAFLVKLEEQLSTFGRLHRFLVNHPALVWVLGFPLTPTPVQPWGFDAARSVPSRKQLGRVLRELDNDALQFLLSASVTCIADALPAGVAFGDTIALDTKHIIAWVKENNPKTFVRNRFDKRRRPKGDPDCRLGCKHKANPLPEESTDGGSATPAGEGHPASSILPTLQEGEYYWGYASGIVVTKLKGPDEQGLAEVVLAELTQPFDRSDQSYFPPLMQRTEATLGRKPRFGALDKAYDAFYVYAYFHEAGGFAAVPWADRADHRKRFTPDGLPLCAAGLPMPRKSTFWKRSHCLVPHERARYCCPFSVEGDPALACPIHHPHADKEDGCITTLPTSIGNRVRHELDRESDEFTRIYNQRSACERINSQALALGIERPHLRNGRSIANIDTLIYVLINLHALTRIRTRLASGGNGPMPVI